MTGNLQGFLEKVKQKLGLQAPMPRNRFERRRFTTRKERKRRQKRWAEFYRDMYYEKYLMPPDYYEEYF